MGTVLKSRVVALTAVAVLAAAAMALAMGSAKSAQAQAFIEPTPAPTNLAAVNGQNPGEVHLTWVSSANADSHWIAGIVAADWHSGDYSNLIWEPANGKMSHSMVGLETGVEYVFTVSAGFWKGSDYVWSGWAPWAQITTDSPTPVVTDPVDSVTQLRLSDLRNGEWLEYYHPDIAALIRAIRWVQDGVTELELEVVQELLYLAYHDHEATGEVVQMPFLETLETADWHAVDGITTIFRGGLGETLKGTLEYRNGITDSQTLAVVAAAATGSARAIPEYLDGGQIFSETRNYSTSRTPDLTVSVVSLSTFSAQTVDMTGTSVNLTEFVVALPLPTDHVIVVLDRRAVTGDFAGTNHGYAIGMAIDNFHNVQNLQNGLHHEVAHYWWRGNADWIDEGVADTIAATASIRQGHTLAAQPNRRKDCAARNLSAIGQPAKSDAQFYCNYYLGEKLFRELQSSMTEQEFTVALQNLYRASRAKPAPTSQKQVRANVAEVRNAFAAQASVVEYHWSGDVNAPHRWDPDDNLNFRSHNAVVWTTKPQYSEGTVFFSGQLTGQATLTSRTLRDAQQGGFANFTIHDSEGNNLGSILPPRADGRHWILDDPGDVVAGLYSLSGNEFTVRFAWPQEIGHYGDKHITVWGFNNADRTPQIGSAVDPLGQSTVR